MGPADDRGFRVFVTDLTPTASFHWYLLVEAFAEHRPIYVAALQLQTIAHIVPLCLRFRREPVLAFVLCAGVVAIFKPYATECDTALWLAMCLLCTRTLAHMRHAAIALSALVFSLLFLARTASLWLDLGQANANYVFAGALARIAAYTALLCDLAYAGRRRRVGRPGARANVHGPTRSSVTGDRPL